MASIGFIDLACFARAKRSINSYVVQKFRERQISTELDDVIDAMIRKSILHSQHTLPLQPTAANALEREE